MTLVERLEVLTEPDRHTADEVLLACEWTQNRVTVDGPLRWYSPNEESPCFELGDQPNPLESLDAALTLVPEENGSNKAGFLQAAMFQRHVGDIPDWKIPIALCIAVLKARGVK
jgi:hypothetical protein